jgi:hypothetical protein
MNYRSSLARTVVMGLMLSPLAAGAQEIAAPAKSHTVKTGDTLWEIARLYLSDPFLWPEVYRLNTAIVEDPHWIFPGETLMLPDPASLGAPVVTVSIEEATGAAGNSEGPTVFSGTGPASTRSRTASERVAVRMPPPPIREWEYYAAPWVDREGGPRGAGKVIASTDISGIGGAVERDQYQFQERIYVTVPPAIMPQVGDRYLTYTLGPVLPDLGQVILPTGIVEVERPGEGEATTVRIVRQFDPIGPGQFVTTFDTLQMPAGGELATIGLGLTARIRWMRNNPLLPSIQQYVVMNASARDGIRLGDRFTFLRPRVRSMGDVTLPEEEIAIGQVIRVTDRAVTVIVVDQTHPAIKEGTLARLTGRMP